MSLLPTIMKRCRHRHQRSPLRHPYNKNKSFKSLWVENVKCDFYFAQAFLSEKSWIAIYPKFLPVSLIFLHPHYTLQVPNRHWKIKSFLFIKPKKVLFFLSTRKVSVVLERLQNGFKPFSCQCSQRWPFLLIWIVNAQSSFKADHLFLEIDFIPFRLYLAVIPIPRRLYWRFCISLKKG